jgi:hypothetical protein
LTFDVPLSPKAGGALSLFGYGSPRLKEFMSRESQFAARAAYALSALLLILPLADIALGFFPLQFDNLRWRIGVTGMTTGALLLPITGLFVALVTAHLRGNRKTQLTFASLAVVGGLLIFAASVMFTLDTLQMRPEIDIRGRHLYDRAALKGTISQLITAGILLFVGLSSLRTSRSLTRQARGRPEVKPAPIMGRADVAQSAQGGS